jgi:hypothetical protein
VAGGYKSRDGLKYHLQHLPSYSPQLTKYQGLALDPEQEPLIQNREERIIRSEPVQGHTTTPTGPNTIAAQPMEPVGRASELTEEQNNLEYVEKIEKLPLEVFSSRAPVGIAGSEAAITFFSPISRRIADKFAEQPKLRNRWKRASFSRPIKQFDLGHWVIETRTWTPKLQLTFWKDLIKQIELKALGNSTWCKRVPEPDQMGTVMVYCWGELVEHVYLILMTISDAKIKSQEVCWLDGENKVVVRVR